MKLRPLLLLLQLFVLFSAGALLLSFLMTKQSIIRKATVPL
jgi:hypothetical protein